MQGGVSLVAQGLRIFLAMQGTPRSIPGPEEPTCHRATKLVCCNYWGHTLQPMFHSKRTTGRSPRTTTGEWPLLVATGEGLHAATNFGTTIAEINPFLKIARRSWGKEVEGSKSDPKLLAFVNGSQLILLQIKNQKHSLNILLRQNKAKPIFNLWNICYYVLLEIVFPGTFIGF